MKVNFPEVLRQELTRPSWTPDVIAFGTATDPYQPSEGHYQLTRRTLETLVEHPAPMVLVTKGPLVVRDRDLLVELSQRTQCSAYLNVPTVDEHAWRTIEPGTASPQQRLKAVRQLADAGVCVGVLIAPVVPGITSKPAMLERTIEAVADAGARRVSANVLHLEGGTRDHFMTFLARHYPQLIGRYERLYRGKYASKVYVDEVRTVVDRLRRRHRPDHWFVGHGHARRRHRRLTRPRSRKSRSRGRTDPKPPASH